MAEEKAERMKHYYALAVELEKQGNEAELEALAKEWKAQGFKYQVFGALDRAVKTSAVGD